jgi:predicted DNA-binding protein YlxM (UPF0122 family)
MMRKDLNISFLLDIYGRFLSEKQRELTEYYYNDDLSLSEIAENEGITRQGVRDAIKRAETQLFDMEKKLGMASRARSIKENLVTIEQCADQISELNMNSSLSKEINDAIIKIKSVISAFE